MYSILDDLELYEQQKPFSLECLKSIAQFANQFVYKSIMDGLFGTFPGLL